MLDSIGSPAAPKKERMAELRVSMSSKIEIRLGCFFGIFTMVAVYEILAPHRPLPYSHLVSSNGSPRLPVFMGE
jgi:hypothetical protein